MAAGLMAAFVITQMVLGLFFLIWLWSLRLRYTKAAASDRREALLRLAVISFTLGVAVDFYSMLGHIRPELHKLSPSVSFSLACIGIALSLLGKGKGRIVTAVACCGLAISWLPFILP